jgi:hypothetical protein
MSKEVFYPKIDTLWKRSEVSFGVEPGDWRQPEFEFVTLWDYYEKIDGMNVSLEFFRGVSWPERAPNLEIRGRGPNTNWKQEQLMYLRSVGSSIGDYVRQQMDKHELSSYEIFGELYGPGIQKGGVYGDRILFRMFDIRVDDKVWLDMSALEEASFSMMIQTAPLLGRADALTISELVQNGMQSHVAYDDYIMEGVVARPPARLFDARGNRVMWKLKGKDFK